MLNNKEQADPQLVHRDEVGEGHLVHPKKVLEEAAAEVAVEAGVEEVEDPPMGMKEERKRDVEIRGNLDGLRISCGLQEGGKN